MHRCQPPTCTTVPVTIPLLTTRHTYLLPLYTRPGALYTPATPLFHWRHQGGTLGGGGRSCLGHAYGGPTPPPSLRVRNFTPFACMHPSSPWIPHFSLPLPVPTRPLFHPLCGLAIPSYSLSPFEALCLCILLGMVRGARVYPHNVNMYSVSLTRIII